MASLEALKVKPTKFDHVSSVSLVSSLFILASYYELKSSKMKIQHFNNCACHAYRKLCLNL